MLEARLKSIFYYGIVVTFQILKRLSCQMFKISNEHFFLEYIDNFSYFIPKMRWVVSALVMVMCNVLVMVIGNVLEKIFIPVLHT